jgi:hypothetical protein
LTSRKPPPSQFNNYCSHWIARPLAHAEIEREVLSFELRTGLRETEARGSDEEFIRGIRLDWKSLYPCRRENVWTLKVLRVCDLV